MQYRPLGRTGIKVSVVAFGAGPVPALLTAGDDTQQVGVVRRAIERGINWFDTAATYGGGQSEKSLGAALAAVGAPDDVRIATKVRLVDDQVERIGESVKASVTASLKRLGRERVALLQLHNSVTVRQGDQPTSLTPAHVLAPGGVLEAMHDLKREGLVEHLGLTGLGDPQALGELVDTGQFATVQIPYNLVNPSAGEDVGGGFAETNYGNLIARCARQGMGVFAIRVLAGGALVEREPSPYTLTTKFFPLDLYERDRQRAAVLRQVLDGERQSADESMAGTAVRYALSHTQVTSAIVGFSDTEQVDEIVAAADRGPLEPDLLARLRNALLQQMRDARQAAVPAKDVQ